MIDLTVFCLGLLVSIITGTAVVLVGIQEAGNPSSSAPEDLTAWEKRVVDRKDSNEPSESQN